MPWKLYFELTYNTTTHDSHEVTLDKKYLQISLKMNRIG